MSEFAGTLSSRIEIWVRGEERDELGSSVGEWSLQERCFANVRAAEAGRMVEGDVQSAMPRYRVTIRSGQAISLRHQIRWLERRLSMREITEDPAQPDRLSILCEEVRG